MKQKMKLAALAFAVAITFNGFAGTSEARGDAIYYLHPENFVHSYNGSVIIEDGIVDSGNDRMGHVFGDVENIETSTIKAENGGRVNFFDVRSLSVTGDVTVTGKKGEISIPSDIHIYHNENIDPEVEKEAIGRVLRMGYVMFYKTSALIGGNVVIDGGLMGIMTCKKPLVIKGNVTLSGQESFADGLNIYSEITVEKANVIIEGDLICNGTCMIMLGPKASIEVKGNFLPSASTSVYDAKGRKQEVAGGMGVMLGTKPVKA